MSGRNVVPLGWVDADGGVRVSLDLRKTIKPGKIVLHSHIFFISEIIRGAGLWDLIALKGEDGASPDPGCDLPSDPFH